MMNLEPCLPRPPAIFVFGSIPAGAVAARRSRIPHSVDETAHVGLRDEIAKLLSHHRCFHLEVQRDRQGTYLSADLVVVRAGVCLGPAFLVSLVLRPRALSAACLPVA
jgi:hypothetical protein